VRDFRFEHHQWLAFQFPADRPRDVVSGHRVENLGEIAIARHEKIIHDLEDSVYGE
jgi:hypothetical protein